MQRLGRGVRAGSGRPEAGDGSATIHARVAASAIDKLGGKTPAEAYRGAPPVDMMDKPLRALPTSPQAQQQRQGDRFKGILAA